MKKAVCLLMIIVTFLSFLGGCRKDSSYSGFVYTEFYSGPETIYPENMPAASRDVPKVIPPNKGFLHASRYPTTFNDLLFNPIFSEYLDSWYRVTIDSVLSEKEAEILGGYWLSGGVDNNTFFKATIWYDYVRQEKMEEEFILSQGGTLDLQYGDDMLLTLGESYIILTALKLADFDFTGYISNKCIYHILMRDEKEVVVQYSEHLPKHDGYNKGFNELKENIISDPALNKAGFIVYDLEHLTRELQRLFVDIVNENDKYYMPTCLEYIQEYQVNREKFLKDTAGAETGDD